MQAKSFSAQDTKESQEKRKRKNNKKRSCQNKPYSAYLICQTFMKSLQKCATLAHSCSVALRGLSECNERMSPGFSQVFKRSDKKLNGNDGLILIKCANFRKI